MCDFVGITRKKKHQTHGRIKSSTKINLDFYTSASIKVSLNLSGRLFDKYHGMRWAGVQKKEQGIKCSCNLPGIANILKKILP